MTRIKPRRGQRAATLLEFVFILPMFLFLIVFILDMSRLLLVSGAVQDSTYRAARAGAIYGGGQLGGNPISAQAFNQALSEIPGGDSVRNYNLVVTRGAECTSSNRYVQVDVVYGVRLMTPGMTGLLNLVGNGQAEGVPGEFTMRSTAVAQCEVARR